MTGREAGGTRMGGRRTPTDLGTPDVAAFACLWRFDLAEGALALTGDVRQLGLGVDGPGDDLLLELMTAVEPADRRLLDRRLRTPAPGAPILLHLHAPATRVRSLWRGAWDARGAVAHGVALAEPAEAGADGRDALTGLLDRAGFLRGLTARLDGGGAGRVVLADLARFSRLNEALGPERADLVLAALGGRLAKAFPRACRPARVGEDEFAVLLDPGPEDASVALRAALEAPLRVAGCDVHPCVAVGAVEFAAGDPAGASELLRRAGLALEAARGVHARSAAYEGELEGHGLSRLALESDCRVALARDEFEPFFQPVIELATGRVAGFEALVRWRHPRLGVLAPDDFLPLLGDAGLLGALGRRMVGAAATQLARWRAEGVRDVFVSVNLTAPDLERPGLAAEVAGVIAAAGLPPGALKLELTEGEVMRDPEAAAAVMHALRDAGAGLAVDDFGMGFSSLSYLTRLPVEVLKIDRYFVRAMGASREAGAVIRSVTALGRDLKLDIVAEGVETAAAATALREMGCRYGQGFGFAPPLPAREAEAFLASRSAAGPRPELRIVG